MAANSTQTDQATLTRAKVQQPRRFKVLLHNDDFTTMDFVVGVLIQYFGKGEADAMRIMLEVHLQGMGIAGVYPRDQAETKVAQVTASAEAEGFPLLVTMEPE